MIGFVKGRWTDGRRRKAYGTEQREKKVIEYLPQPRPVSHSFRCARIQYVSSVTCHVDGPTTPLFHTHRALTQRAFARTKVASDRQHNKENSARDKIESCRDRARKKERTTTTMVGDTHRTSHLGTPSAVLEVVEVPQLLPVVPRPSRGRVPLRASPMACTKRVEAVNGEV